MIRKLIPNLGALSRTGASLIVQTAAAFDSRVMVEHDQKIVNAKSLLGLLSVLSASRGSVNLVCEGADEAAASEAVLSAIEKLRAAGEGENGEN